MFFKYDNACVRYTGRFAEYGGAMTATAPGSEIAIAFSGDNIILSFDTENYKDLVPHIYLQLDGGDLFESAIASFLRVSADNGEHILRIIYKSAVEAQSRFYHPLVGKIAFKGFYADNTAALPTDSRKTIEFVGDSITEGVLIDVELFEDAGPQETRPFVDDVTATYAYLTAKHFGLKNLHMGYGAVGVTCGGQGMVPKAADAYPYCFEGAPVAYPHPDYIVINHGANDRRATPEQYITEYRALLELIRNTHKNSVIIVLSAFCGAFPTELCNLVKNFNAEHDDNIHFIDASEWGKGHPLHPLRNGHKEIAEKLIKELEGIIK